MHIAGTQTKLLVVDDDRTITDLIRAGLELAGYEVSTAGNGLEAIEKFATERPALVLLDVTMPVVSGLEVLQHVRTAGTTPVILVSGLTTEESRVRGLRLGADDYVTKPFSMAELECRVEAVLRRANVVSPTTVIEHRDLQIDLAGRTVSVGGREVEMTAKEFDLLAFFAAAPGRVYTRAQLLRDVWHSSTEWQQEGTVTEHVRRLRVKIEEDPERPLWLQTVRGVGYRFERRRAPRPAEVVVAA